jgi:nucleoside 2-deoxyribosyltransferase
VWDNPDEEGAMARCFAIQPFDDNGPYDRRYAEVLSPAIVEAGLEPYRVDQDPMVTIPIDDIEQGIRDAEICLADITENNPNVWYEVGFAMANGKPIVLICADPRPEKFPFDVRHRHIIRYTKHSASDFEKLKIEVTTRLKAQAKKAEELQTAAAMSQITTTKGLSPHEISVLISIMSLVSNPVEGVHPYRIQESMKRSGYTAMASTLALAGLKRKDMIDYGQEMDSNENVMPVCIVTKKGLDWMLENEDRFRMRVAEERAPEPEPHGAGSGAITDEDIPF